jgi:hypothetical protein
VSDWWNVTPLGELSPEQWEDLCDGCAKCCLHKLEDADTGEVFYTKVRCRYLDEQHCRCSDYQNRSRLVPNCISLSPDNTGLASRHLCLPAALPGAAAAGLAPTGQRQSRQRTPGGHLHSRARRFR